MISREEMLFKAKLIGDLKSAQLRGAVVMTISQMQMVTNLAAAIVGELGLILPPCSDQQPENNQEQSSSDAP
jgi:hypothetical protein